MQLISMSYVPSVFMSNRDFSVMSLQLIDYFTSGVNLVSCKSIL